MTEYVQIQKSGNEIPHINSGAGNTAERVVGSSDEVKVLFRVRLAGVEMNPVQKILVWKIFHADDAAWQKDVIGVQNIDFCGGGDGDVVHIFL